VAIPVISSRAYASSHAGISTVKKKAATKPAKVDARSWQEQIAGLVKNGGVYAESEKGEVLYARNPDMPFIPASILKVATASAALDLLGENYRFPTEFYFDRDHKLWIKGYGDPALVSEELALIARDLKGKGLERVTDIYLDDTYFAPNIDIPGSDNSLNPYDAHVGALIANFNTISVIKRKNGTVISAEPTTPTTEINSLLASKAPIGESRINISHTHPREAVLYVGHLLKAFLAREGIPVQGAITITPVPERLAVSYTHLQSQPLREILRGMLEHSTNFTANQIFLHLGAKLGRPPATLAQSSRILQKYMNERVGIKGSCFVEEGCGLSRQNTVSPRDMAALLKHFEPHYDLLKEKKGRWTKTGTLKGVYCLAGYFPSSRYGLVRFAIMLNQASNGRDKIADLLEQGLAQ
jgi:D-alanyl-D-alanine carboxypeptidase/D-alanyl-D-alanine-endopeptidase (penicillin-binding protein 4)